MAGDLEVPDKVRQQALTIGAPGRAWLDSLPDLLAALAARWHLTIGDAKHGGTASYVAGVTDESGTLLALKLAMPPEDQGTDTFRRSVLVHRFADGSGCARLVAYDEGTRALLLEHLGPNVHELDMSLPAVFDAIAATLHDFWRPVRDLAGAEALPTGADQARWLAGFITTTWSALDRPCDRAVVDRALAYCEARAAAFDVSRAVLVHGDAHGWNTLDAGGGTYKFVDPEGLRSEPAHDLGVLSREYNQPLLDGDTPALVRERVDTLAARTGVEPESIWQWAFIERVSTGLANVRAFDDGEGELFLEVATRCL